jgi:hypothetical protein
MEIEELKSIPIDKLLSLLGCEPVNRIRGGTQLLYRSPFRGDRHPSFSVSVVKNVWQDYATGTGGNVIDLAILLNGNCSFHDAAVWLEEQSKALGRGPVGVLSSRETVAFIRETDPVIKDVKVTDLTHRALLSYLHSRQIPMDIGTKYCREAHYSVRGRPYYGICFLNILGGMEIRNAYFKGCHGAKAPSVVPLSKQSRSEACCIFEGFMDFLSFKTLVAKGFPNLFDSDCIVLNSTSIVSRAIPFIDVYDKAYAFTDNDLAGRMALERIESAMPGKITSLSDMYYDFNDLNDFLMHSHGSPR